jgi:hypothetical protein
MPNICARTERFGSVPRSNTKSELEAQLDRLTIQPDDPDHAQTASSTQPDDTRTTREKALAASAPGSEYWLP